jgi:DNA (cytosine-5)-methyltransferase 1
MDLLPVSLDNIGMPDVLTAPQRSYNMSQIRARGTAPEKKLDALLRAEGLHGFATHPSQIKGKPDIYFPQEKVAVFMDGCFWHACDQCFRMPGTNRQFWKNKIETNVLRDRKVDRHLKAEGIKVLRIQEHELKKNPEKIVSRIRKKIPAAAPRVLDLFAGAGGLSEGFIAAGCEIVAHIEMEKKACRTLVTRMVYHALLRKGKLDEYKNYVLGKVTLDSLIAKYGLEKERDSVICEKIGKDNYRRLIREVKKRLNGEQLDIIVGGPPCQAYSHIGRARDERRMKWDHRKFLYRYYVDFLKAFKPKIFVFENVPGLMSSGGGVYLKAMRKLMKQAGYKTDLRVVNAADFGVPQNRNRIILVGWNSKSKLKKYPDLPPVKRSYVVKDFLAGLPRLKAGTGKPLVKKFQRRNPLLEKLGIASTKFGILMEHVARPNTKQDLEIYRRAVLTKRKGKIMKYDTLPKRLKTHKNDAIFLDRFKVVDGNARGSHTIVAHVAKDGHFYIHPDLKQNRSLTVRETARLQTFPDNYKFEGERGPQFKQIGNAVPPMLSAVIAKELIKYI